MRNVLASVLLLASGCGAVPRDTDGMLDRVRREGVIRVGVTEPAAPASVALMRRVAVRVGARPAIERGPLEPLLLKLEAGELDLVAGGRFAADSGWKTRVALGPKLDEAEVAEAKTHAHLAARNGENATVALIEREARAAGMDR